MPMDVAVADAVLDTVSEHGQPDAVAKQLIAWLDSLADGKVSIDDAEDVSRRIETILDRVNIDCGT